MPGHAGPHLSSWIQIIYEHFHKKCDIAENPIKPGKTFVSFLCVNVHVKRCTNVNLNSCRHIIYTDYNPEYIFLKTSSFILLALIKEDKS